jgi:replicative DNA helicase
MNLETNTPEKTEQLEVFAFEEIKTLVRQTLPHQPQIHNTPQIPFMGFSQLDQIIGGLEKGQLYSLVSRPGSGKTAFLLSVVNNLAVRNNFSVAIFSMERSGTKIAQRLIESETGLPISKLQNSKLKDSERDRVQTLVSSIEKAKIVVDNTRSLTTDDLVSRARAIKKKADVDIIAIDFLELLAANETDLHPDDRIAKTVATLKNLAQEIDVPILLFSQLESSASFFQKPSLNETSIALSEISDTVLLLHRKTPAEIATNGTQKNVKIIISKSPGLEKTEEVNLNFIETTGKFVDF